MARNSMNSSFSFSRVVFHLCRFSLIALLSILTIQRPAVAQEAVSTENEKVSELNTSESTKDTDSQNDESEVENTTVIKGYFLAESEHPIASRPQEWGEDLRVESCVAHGARVQQGDVLITFSSRKLDQALQDQHHTVLTARLALEKARGELELLNKSTRMSVSDAERAVRLATEDLQRFVTTEQDQRKENMQFSLKSAEDYLAYQEEELKQLVKMYEADDLTEETEEIVLRRTRDDVERSRHNRMLARQSFEKELNVNLPISKEQLEEALKKASLALEKAAEVAKNEMAEKEASVEKLNREFARAEERLTRLTADQKWMTLKAPIPGLVYLGEHRLGKWPDPVPLAANLRLGGNAKPHQVLMTVVSPQVKLVAGTVDEADLTYLKKDSQGELVVSAFPNQPCTATLADVSPIPFGDEKFLVTFQPSLAEGIQSLVPGMTCEITIEKSK